MPRYRSYIADRHDPSFRWDDPSGARVNGNLPRRLVPAEWYHDLGLGYGWYQAQV